MSKHTQNGSAHIIIIAVLLIGLLCALGFIFWSNFIDKNETKTTSNTNKTENKKAEVKMLTVKNNTFGSTVAMNYPETWTLKQETGRDYSSSENEDVTYSRQLITSPDEKITIQMSIQTIQGLGGVCSDDYKLEAFETAPVPNYKDVRYVAYVTSSPTEMNEEKFYSYTVGIQKVDTTTRGVSEIGQNACSFIYAGMLTPTSNADLNENIKLMVYMSFNDISKDKISEKDVLDAYKQQIKSQYYKEGKRIMQSLHSVQ